MIKLYCLEATNSKTMFLALRKIRNRIPTFQTHKSKPIVKASKKQMMIGKIHQLWENLM